ncbi:MAG: hypothetical protein K8U57_35030 [Planctomycetes bacterium]|nr:hypothetical protein [Planctomycetota bacterium]
MSRLRVPTANGDVLAVPDFDAIPALVEENRRRLHRDDVQIGGMSLRELRTLARREVLKLAGGQGDGPLLLAGHQPELSHPGVWAKNFALNGLAKKAGGTALNLIVDNDTLKSTSIRFPVVSDKWPVHLESVAFDTFTGEVPYEDRKVIDPAFFDSFAERAAPMWANWGFEPLLATAWHTPVHAGPKATIGDRFTTLRHEYEVKWGCHNRELSVSRLSQMEAFRRFAQHILADLPGFRGAYNTAIRTYRDANGIHSKNHPAPELADGEAPFWIRRSACRRERATSASDVCNFRPRALTLTLFARVCLGDFFIHGIGGGKYDEVTDDIIRNFFGIEPPAYQVLSATLHLPLPTFPSTPHDLKRAERLVRDLHWNPQRYLPAGTASELLVRKAALARSEPSVADHAARKTWFRELQQLTEQLRVLVAGRVPLAEAELTRIRAEVAANEVLQRRDYSWVLYPEETLRPFLQRFLAL